jgi:Tol biopolymer transport system component
MDVPPEMRIVRCELDKADGTAASLKTLIGDGKAYCAEGSLSKDGRNLLYCSLESNEGDLFVLDLKTNNKHRLVQAKGYDGGPFFSPDGKRICYRSDRHGDNLLQLLVADLTFNDKGEIVGIERETLLTDDTAVNWCPFWTPDGRRLVYGTSALGHTNYEIFICDADPGNLPGSNGTIRYGTAQRQITHASGADVLPALSSDGQWMVWTSQRHADRSSQLWAARFVLDAEKPWKASAEKTDTTSAVAPKTDKPAKTEKPAKPSKHDDADGDRMTVTDPDTGRIFIYDMSTHKLSEYHMDTHTLTDVTDKALIEHVIDLFNQQGADEPQ